ncbi:MAG: hypothetical protein AAF266_03110 [Planctomycetota bacterium]
MRNHLMLLAAACGTLLCLGVEHARAQSSAEAQVVFTITLNDILLIGADETSVSAYDEFAIEVFDAGANTAFFGGGSPNNPFGAVGSSSATEEVLFAGVDVEDPDFNAFDTGLFPGDTIVVTQNVETSALTPDAIFFAQIDSEVSLFFDSFGNEDQRFLFDFDVEADLVGEFDLGTTADSASVIAEGTEIVGFADSTVSGEPNEFILFAGENDRFYDIVSFTGTGTAGVIPVTGSGNPINVPIEFSPGDNQFEITFRSSLVVNARTGAADPDTGLAGDYNNDGEVNAADYTTWRDANDTGGKIRNETATPGTIDGADYTEWTTRFGDELPPASAAIPEPIAVVSLLFGLLFRYRRGCSISW